MYLKNADSYNTINFVNKIKKLDDLKNQKAKIGNDIKSDDMYNFFLEYSQMYDLEKSFISFWENISGRKVNCCEIVSNEIFHTKDHHQRSSAQFVPFFRNKYIGLFAGEVRKTEFSIDQVVRLILARKFVPIYVETQMVYKLNDKKHNEIICDIFNKEIPTLNLENLNLNSKKEFEFYLGIYPEIFNQIFKEITPELIENDIQKIVNVVKQKSFNEIESLTKDEHIEKTLDAIKYINKREVSKKL